MEFPPQQQKPSIYRMLTTVFDVDNNRTKSVFWATIVLSYPISMTINSILPHRTTNKLNFISLFSLCAEYGSTLLYGLLIGRYGKYHRHFIITRTIVRFIIRMYPMVSWDRYLFPVAMCMFSNIIFYEKTRIYLLFPYIILINKFCQTMERHFISASTITIPLRKFLQYITYPFPWSNSETEKIELQRIDGFNEKQCMSITIAPHKRVSGRKSTEKEQRQECLTAKVNSLQPRILFACHWLMSKIAVDIRTRNRHPSQRPNMAIAKGGGTQWFSHYHLLKQLTIGTKWTLKDYDIDIFIYNCPETKQISNMSNNVYEFIKLISKLVPNEIDIDGRKYHRKSFNQSSRIIKSTNFGVSIITYLTPILNINSYMYSLQNITFYQAGFNLFRIKEPYYNHELKEYLFAEIIDIAVPIFGKDIKFQTMHNKILPNISDNYFTVNDVWYPKIKRSIIEYLRMLKERPDSEEKYNERINILFKLLTFLCTQEPNVSEIQRVMNKMIGTIIQDTNVIVKDLVITSNIYGYRTYHRFINNKKKCYNQENKTDNDDISERRHNAYTTDKKTEITKGTEGELKFNYNRCCQML